MDVNTNYAVTQSNMAFKKFPKNKAQAKALDDAAFKISHEAYLNQLKKTNPEMYKHVLMADVEHHVASMSNWECIKFLFKSLFSKVK